MNPADTHARAAEAAHKAILSAVAAIKLAAETGYRLDEDQGRRWEDLLTAFRLRDLPNIVGDEKMLAIDIAVSVSEIENDGSRKQSP